MELLTVKEVARICRVHEMTIRRHIKQGRLRAVRVGRQIRVPSDALEQLAGVDAGALTLLDPNDAFFLLEGAATEADATDIASHKQAYIAESLTPART